MTESHPIGMSSTSQSDFIDQSVWKGGRKFRDYGTCQTNYIWQKKQTTTTTHTSIWCLLKFCSIAVSHAFGTNEGNLHTLGHWVTLLFGVCISDCYSYWEISPASYGLPIMVMAPTMLTESVLLLHATSPKHICQKLTLTWWSQIALGCCETSQLCLFCSSVSLSSLSFNSWNSVFHGPRERPNIIGTVACFHDF